MSCRDRSSYRVWGPRPILGLQGLGLGAEGLGVAVNASRNSLLGNSWVPAVVGLWIGRRQTKLHHNDSSWSVRSSPVITKPLYNHATHEWQPYTLSPKP